MPKFDAAALGVTPTTATPPATGGGKFGASALGLPATPQKPASPYVGLAANYAAQLKAANFLSSARITNPAQRTKYLEGLIKQLAPSKGTQERDQLRVDLAKSLGWGSAGLPTPTAPASQFRGMVGDTDPAVYQRAIEKQRAGKPLTTQEAQAVTAMTASQKALTGVGVALQPFFALSDITKGLLMAAKTGNGGAVQRGFDAAAGHLTYGAAEYLPGVAGARARGVSGEQLLVGTKYEGDPAAALWVEVLADPSILLSGAGLVAKTGATAGRLASIEKLAQSAEGAVKIRDVLQAANKVGDVLIKAGDEITGVPAAVRGVAGSKAAGAIKTTAQKLADTTLPAPVQRISGARTAGDLLLTPDQKLSIYTPEQLARDEFRTGARVSADETRTAINAAVNPDAKFVTNLTKGLKPAEAKEAVRLLGVFTNATDPKVAEMALQKIVQLGSTVGKDLETPFVAAVKATDRIGQETIGPLLKAEALPVVLNPAVTKAIQEAETGKDLLPLIGKYTTAEGRPRGILMTQYSGRGNVDQTIAKITAQPNTPAKAAVEIAPVKATLDAAVKDAPLPPRPIEPMGIKAAGELPINPAGRAVQVAETPVNVTPPFVQGAARQAVDVARSPQEVLADLFGKSEAQALPTPVRASAAPTPTAAPINTAASVTPTAPRPPAAVLEEMLTPPASAAPTPAPVVADNVAPAIPDPVPVAAEPIPAPTPVSVSDTLPAAPAVVDNVNPAPVRDPITAKTPNDVLRDLISPAPAADGFVTPKIVTVRNNLSDLREAIKPTAVPERMVERSVPTTYRTVQVEANAIDWGGMDAPSRRAVLNSIEGGNTVRFARDASGNLRAQQSSLTVPLNHPIVSHYVTDETLEAARYPGTPYGERVVTRREKVPEWYNPRDPEPMEIQRALHEQAQQEAYDARYAANDLKGMLRDDEPFGNLDTWIVGNAYVSYGRLEPASLNTRAAMNEFAARVTALNGRAATKGEVFAYRMALSRYRQASNVRQLDTMHAADELHDFIFANPEATLAEAAAHLARAFDLGTAGKNMLKKAMAQTESGFTRQMSRLERLEFAQRIKLRDTVQQGAPGGMLLNRMLRKPEEVSAEFKQVFPLEENALKVLDEQVRTRSAAIVRSQQFRQYADHLKKNNAHLTAKELDQIRRFPLSQLTPDQRTLRESIARATEQGGAPAGWKIMDRSVGPFEKGDAVPWWAYHDLFGASSIDDAAVSARILERGSLGETYDRAWRSMNAFMLGSPTSIINDQVGQFMQMALWGVTPDAVIEGMIRRATATPEQLKIMRESGIGGTSLESSIQAGRLDLTRAARKLDNDSDLSRMGRVVDTVLRFNERGVGLDPTAMTGVAGVAADAAHFGSGYLFRARSRMADFQREALYFHRLQLGDSSAQAAAYTNQVMMDMRLVPAYARVVGKVWPFFNWIAMSGPRSIITVLRKPSINAAAQRFAAATDSDSPEDAARRVLARDRGWLNLNTDERNGTRIYLDPRSWDPTNTYPQLIDFRGTKIGVVSPPWWATLALGLQNGNDRFGGNIYAEVLDGQRGGFNEAARIDPKGAWKAAAKFIYTQFNPTYAPGSTRAKAFTASVIETAKLPQDGSRDIAIAHTLMGTPQGRAFLSYMQSGNLALIDPELVGNRGSQYSDAPASMARAAGSFVLPLRGVNADQNVQGTAAQALSVGLLNLQNWKAGEIKRLQQLEAGGASRAVLHAAEDRAEQEYNRRAGRLDTLDRVTR